ncbi:MULTISPECIES: YciI family protein [Bacillus]|uniref:YciI family protein n=1 Tax=Bacillus TaxID=1386 RepID=UPI00031AF29D|nr:MULTISPECIES: YciI family protein [Bacillus]MBO1583350.1 hypothetical protein [Bacillus sp. XF8]MBY0600475.1 YciI family protein [Bacillus bingmayongensis]
MNYFVILFTQGENWEQGKRIWEQDLEKHRDFWREYREKTDKVIGAGPFTDDAGGMIILEIESLDEATRIVNLDPAVIGKIFKTTVHPWHPLLKRF